MHKTNLYTLVIITNFRSLTKLQKFGQLSDFQPNFKRSTKFRNFHQISEILPTLRLSTEFQTFNQILECQPNYGISIKTVRDKSQGRFANVFENKIAKKVFPAFVFQWLFSVCCYM